VSAVLELYMQMMLIDGLFTPIRPGNLLVAPDGKVVLLDFGMVVEVPREMRWHLVSTVFAAIRRDTEGVIAGFESMGFVEPWADMAKIRELADMLMKLAGNDGAHRAARRPGHGDHVRFPDPATERNGVRRADRLADRRSGNAF
jgi:predicted unusual protein kinase regulating ubiquinone biosynthesis (AarF/ABC1/UbiB family)